LENRNLNASAAATLAAQLRSSLPLLAQVVQLENQTDGGGSSGPSVQKQKEHKVCSKTMKKPV